MHIHWASPPAITLLWFWNKLTGGCLITGTYALYPAYYKLSTISEGDCTIVVAAEFLEVLKIIVPKGTVQRKTYNIAKQLINSPTFLLEY